MTSEQRRYVFVQSVIGAAVVNALINAAIGWAAMRAQSEFPIWKVPGVAVDVVATAFGVAFGTCLGGTIQARVDFRKGKVTVPSPLPFATLVARLPSGLMKRAIVLGIVAMPIFIPGVLLALKVTGLEALSPADFIGLKAGFSGVEGAVVTPLIVLAALSEQSQRVKV